LGELILVFVGEYYPTSHWFVVRKLITQQRLLANITLPYVETKLNLIKFLIIGLS